MTEEEARAKWCPFVRYSVAFDDYASNRWKQSLPEDEPHALNPVPCRCIGSACMSWRWVQRITNKKEIYDYQHYIGAPRAEPIYENTEHGFCGLAGKP